ncbi:bZIP transcription factor 27-like [Impatiens glandulifera]|uniref:bZIP transcription factor 27-like n=1 Tax=Impatiens glandulifera TaxID=253017 RepID=UPI001FB191CC|nr:bZIP transcription factor 27-like [Impatiens glandulifera]
MEEVWKDMTTLSSSSKEESHVAANSFTFQDFLGRPFCPPTTLNHVVSSLDDDHLLPSSTTLPRPPPSAAATLMGKKRFPDQNDGNPTDDRRHKRMIKNRESAARSRARKQAYTNELEQEIANLTKENAMLKLQLCIELAGAEAPKKNTLQRTSTAPF